MHTELVDCQEVLCSIQVKDRNYLFEDLQACKTYYLHLKIVNDYPLEYSISKFELLSVCILVLLNPS